MRALPFSSEEVGVLMEHQRLLDQMRRSLGDVSALAQRKIRQKVEDMVVRRAD